MKIIAFQENIMINSFSREEKIALIAIIKFVAGCDGDLTDAELAKFNEIAEEEGFEDFNEIFDEVDRKVHDIDDISGLMKNITEKVRRMEIIRYAVETAVSDGEINSDEADVLDMISGEWDIDLETITGEL